MTLVVTEFPPNVNVISFILGTNLISKSPTNVFVPEVEDMFKRSVSVDSPGIVSFSSSKKPSAFTSAKAPATFDKSKSYLFAFSDKASCKANITVVLTLSTLSTISDTV